MIKLIFWILALLLGGYGIFSITDPEDAIYLANFWRFDDFLPSERYIRWTRVGGVFFIIFAIVLIVMSLTLPF